MSVFFEGNGPLINYDTMITTVAKYIPSQLLERDGSKITRVTPFDENMFFDDGEEKRFAKLILESSKDKIAIYGAAEELVDQLRIFRNFSGAHAYFNSNFTEPYFNRPILYQSLNDQQFICKSDLFVHLQNMALNKDELLRSRDFLYVMSIFLKFHEAKLRRKVEFVEYDPEVFKEIETEFEESTKKIRLMLDGEEDMYEVFDSNSSFEEVYEEVQEAFPCSWNENLFGDVGRILKRVFEHKNKEERSDYLNWYITSVELVFETFDSIISKHPEMFLPFADTMDNTMPVTVRLFEDRDQKFVMKKELFEAMKKPYNIETSEPVFGILLMEWNDVINQFGDRIKNIEFIRTPIIRAKHKAVPILEPGDFCILAVDALFETLKTAIHGVQFFQKCPDRHRSLLLYGVLLLMLFDPKVESRYFVKMCAYLHAVRTIEVSLKPCEEVEANEIRKVKPTGFSVEDLKNELIHLKLTELFPRIADHAEVVYEHVNSVKKGRFLTTCDMIDAVEHCQLICVFHMIPDLKTFLHNQKSCGRVLTLKCSTCIPPVKPPKHQDCEECLKNENSLEETKKEMKTNKNRMKKLEKKVKGYNERIEEVKRKNEESKEQIMKDLEEKENELEELKRNLDENSHVTGENLAFQLKIQQLKSTNSELKDNFSSQEHAYLTTQAALNDHISQLEAEKEKHQYRRFSDDENSKFNLEIQEKTQQIHEFHETNIRLKAENEFKEGMIQQLMEKLASSSSSFK